VRIAAIWAFSLALALGGVGRGEGALAPPELPVDLDVPEPTVEPAPTPSDVGVETVGPEPGTPTVDLSRAIALALEGNYGLLGSADEVVAARLRESVSRSAFLPQITPTYTRTLSDVGTSPERRFALDATQRVPWLNGQLKATGAMRTQPLEDPLRSRASDVTLSLSQPLLRDFGPLAGFNDVHVSRRAREGQERLFVLAQQTLAVQVTTAFYQVVRQRQLLTVARQSLTRSETLLHASESRMKAGLASKLDVYRAQLQLSYAQSAMVSAETELQTALEDFRVLLGRNPTDALEPAAVTLPEDSHLQLELPPLSILIDRAFANRLDLQETSDQVADARRSATLARQNLLPRLDLNLAATRTGIGPSFGTSVRSLGDNRLDVFLSTSYPIERSSERANKALAEINVTARQRGLAQRRLEIEAEVRQAVRNMDRIVKNVELQRQGVDLAAQQHRLATLRYQRGVASNFDVVEAEERLVAARATLIGLLADFQVARVRLLRVTGELDVTKEIAP
jgi:outer membrane protein